MAINLKDIVKQASNKANDGLKNVKEIAKNIDLKKINIFKIVDEDGNVIDVDNELQIAITNYNNMYTIFNDNGYKLFTQRERALDLISNIQLLINSIANKPKDFIVEIEQIKKLKDNYLSVLEYAEKELVEAQKSVFGAGAGTAAGVAVASLAPTAAMWVATTFGTASTGVAISTLSGAAAQSAALAWLGGGALAAGGGGVAAGNALLALSGPIGWGLAGASILTSIILFRNQKIKIGKQKLKEIEEINANTNSISKDEIKIESLLMKTVELREKLNLMFVENIGSYEKNFLELTDSKRLGLATLVNNTLSLCKLLGEKING